jgi:hypothetical protein
LNNEKTSIKLKKEKNSETKEENFGNESLKKN